MENKVSELLDKWTIFLIGKKEFESRFDNNIYKTMKAELAAQLNMVGNAEAPAELKRYNLYGASGFNEGSINREVSEDGEWVKYEDLTSVLAANEEAEKKYKELWSQALVVIDDKCNELSEKEKEYTGLKNAYDLSKINGSIKNGIIEEQENKISYIKSELKSKKEELVAKEASIKRWDEDYSDLQNRNIKIKELLSEQKGEVERLRKELGILYGVYNSQTVLTPQNVQTIEALLK